MCSDPEPPVPGSPRAPALFRDPDLIAAAVRGCPSVYRLTAGPFGASAACLAGRRVDGVEIAGEAVRVHVVGRYGPTMAEIGAEVRDALADVIPGAEVDVVVEDLATETDPAVLGARRPTLNPAHE
ncbi:hypothetical protein [Peterkaempfera bronchialis]|uniref:Asp23/Gls24 family envelope stress response protein n=1 Tax=Peterkaempfera bronchialis TaxID=2126346 RepID=A0A345SZC5_9ACTN|nr:hypothetical protein [Peterkaempfera bronchialis]AXI79080.1 hypothetical protein C7M71_018330 [Peterkaempfera bronchialis]